MPNKATTLVLASAVAVGTVATALAAPVPMNSLAARGVTTSGDVTKVRWSRWHGGWYGPRPFIGGLILGGAIAAPY